MQSVAFTFSLVLAFVEPQTGLRIERVADHSLSLSDCQTALAEAYPVANDFGWEIFCEKEKK